MLVKYMGSADIRQVPKGEDLGGQLKDKTTVDLSWDRSNNWVIDTSDEKYSSVSDEFWQILIESDDFKDVTELQRVPTNLHQQIFLGMKKSEASETPTSEVQQHQAGADEDPDANPPSSEASPSPARTSTVGGSTSGDSGTRGTKGSRS